MARPQDNLPADISFRAAGRHLLMTSFETLRANVAGTRAGEVEALHDMRVASRRLRASLAVFAKLFPRDEFAAINAQVGAITTALGGVRELDVLLENLAAMRAGLPDNEAYGIDRVIDRQTRRREKERKALLRALDRLERSKFERRFLRAMEPLTDDPPALLTEEG